MPRGSEPSGGKDIVTDCILWEGYIGQGGYGRMSKGGQPPAHRYIWELVNGPIPEGLELDHLCRVPACVNWEHLEPVTHRENLRRGNGWSGINAKKRTCPQGHTYDEENTYNYHGWRQCKKCRHARNKERYQ